MSTVTAYRLEESVRNGLAEYIRFKFTNNELEKDWDRLSETVDVRISESIDSSLIYTHDIIELWQDLNCPDPEDWTGYSIYEGITWAVYETMRERIDVEDIITGALTELRDAITEGELSFTWTGDMDKADQLDLMERLEEAEDGPELLDALAEFRSAVEL